MRRTHSSTPAVVGAQTRSPAERRGSVVATVVAAAVGHTLLLGVLAPVAAVLALVGVAVGVAATA
jgi:hypothetical protein